MHKGLIGISAKPPFLRPLGWALFCLLMLGIYLAAWPLLWRAAVLPHLSDAKAGLRLEVFSGDASFGSTASGQDQQSSHWWWRGEKTFCLAYGVWQVQKGGRYLIQLTTDDAGQVEIDGRTVLATSGLHRANGDSAQVELVAGPHLLVIRSFNGPGAGMVDLKVRGPGQKKFARLDASSLGYLDLGNFSTLRAATNILRGLAGIGLFLGVSFLAWAGLAWLWQRYWLPGRVAGRPAFWLGLGAALSLGLVLGSWPLVRGPALFDQAGSPGLGLAEYVGARGRGPLERSAVAPSTNLTLARNQSSARGFAVWRVPETGVYRLNLSARDFGYLHIDRQPVAFVSPREEERFSVDAALHLEKGPHLLELGLTRREHGVLGLSVSGPQTPAGPLDGPRLRALGPTHARRWLNLTSALEYAGLLGLGLCLTGLGWLLLAPARWREWAGEFPAGYALAGLSAALGLALILRIVFAVDLEYPAWGARLMTLAGLAGGFAALGLGAYRLLRGRGPGESSARAQLVCLISILGIAAALRMVFLSNMEYQADEKDMWHLAVNLVREQIAYLTGNLSSRGHRNPAGFLYLLGIPAALSKDPLHGGLFIALINLAAVGMTFKLAARHLGPMAGLTAGVLLATCPWAIRFSLNIWPQNLVAPLFLAICLLIPSWVERDGWRRSIIIGLLANLLCQMHFTGMLLLGGLGLAALGYGLRLPWRRLGLAALAFALPWTPHVIYLLGQGPGSQVVGKTLDRLGAGDLGPVRSLYWLLGGILLDDIGTIGNLAWEFKLLAWPGHYLGFALVGALALCGLWLWAFGRLPKGPAQGLVRGDWLRAFLWAALIGLAALIILAQRNKMHYVEFLLPWPFVLAGAWVAWLGRDAGQSPLRRWLQGAALALVLALSLSGAGFFMRWQTHLGMAGGGGDFKPVYSLQRAAELTRIKITPHLPDQNAPRLFE